MLFYPADPERLRRGTVVIRASADPAAMAPAIRRLVAEVDPDQPIQSLETGTEALLETNADPRFLAVIMGALAGAALFLAAIGIYGLVSFSVAQRRREIGVRIALGAWSARVMLDVVRAGLALGAAGIAIGLTVTVVVGGHVSELLYQTSPLDPVILALAAVTLLASCAFALVGPARRAAAADPAEALRAE